MHSSNPWTDRRLQIQFSVTIDLSTPIPAAALVRVSFLLPSTSLPNAITKYFPPSLSLVAAQCPPSNIQQVNEKMSKLNGTPQSLQPGNINAQIRRPLNVQSTNWVQGPTSLDEFKYGFPSGGLPSISNKWWGSSCPDETNNEVDDKHHFKVVNDGSASIIDQEKSGSIEEDLQADLQGTHLLTALRKRSLERGRKVLKHDEWINNS
ncbi:uncharacterized protein LOC111437021 isoform X2 [Cucurbita moschata]|uniref:Uncharacterized protein LOC111437021 isoform X2 n=1 Tax=Cucurbita moschata TaxID=3662 RepID=A0A6J1ER19_CUCMO|nr:uncharacterized protein LOC111437021 isoform X2 [Cucurbita moschata]